MPTNTVVGSARAIFTISLVAAATEEVRVDWATKDGTALAGRDYETNSGTVAFAPGETVKTVEVFVHGRTVETEDRVFYVLLAPPVNALLADEIGACVIHVDATGTTPVVTVIIPRGEKGLTGDSAYQIALNNGFVGTQPEWLASLRPSPEELAPLVAPLINAGVMIVTAETTETTDHPDTEMIKSFAGRIAYMGKTRKAFAPPLTAGSNVVPLNAFVGDTVVPTSSTGFKITVLRGDDLVDLAWEYLPDSQEFQIDGAIAGDVAIAVQQDVGVGDASNAIVKVDSVSKKTSSWLKGLLDNAQALSESLDQLTTDLFSSAGLTVGLWLIGCKRFVGSISTTAGKLFARIVAPNVFDYMTEDEILDIESGASLLDHTAAIQAALDAHVYLKIPPGNFNAMGLVDTKFGRTLIGAGSKAYGGGTVLRTSSTTVDILKITKPTATIKGICFIGASDAAEKGEDVLNCGLNFQGATQKDLDAQVDDCAFLYFRSGERANGTNVLHDKVTYSNCKYGFEPTLGGGWENRGFIFSANCRFHSIGKTGVVSAGVYCPGAMNVQDVVIGGVLSDDTATLFRGFASGLKISGVTDMRARASGIVLDASGHGVAASRRTVHINDYTYHGNEAVSAAYPTSSISASGLMTLFVDGVLVRGCGGHGLDLNVTSQAIKNVHICDASQFAHNTYDGLVANGPAQTLQNISSSQDLGGTVYANKMRYSLNINQSAFVSGLNPQAGATAIMTVSPGAIIRGDLPAMTGPAAGISWVNAMPTSGTYQQGHMALLRTPNLAGPAGGRYFIRGWTRLATGSAHVPNADWAAEKILTGE